MWDETSMGLILSAWQALLQRAEGYLSGVMGSYLDLHGILCSNPPQLCCIYDRSSRSFLSHGDVKAACHYLLLISPDLRSLPISVCCSFRSLHHCSLLRHLYYQFCYHVESSAFETPVELDSALGSAQHPRNRSFCKGSTACQDC